MSNLHIIYKCNCRETLQAKCFSRFVAVLIAVAIFFLPGCSENLSSDSVKQFQQGLELFAQAQNPDDYLQSAQCYETLLKQNIKTGAVYYNLGNAYAMAGDKPAALAAYRQAVPYMPGNARLQDNILSVGGKNRPTPLFENLFFWQNWISFPAKAVLATILLCLLALTAIIWLTVKIKAFKYVAAILFLFTLCAFVSVQYDYYRFVQIQHGVISESKVIARKGDAQTYAEAFTQPLTAGTEFTLEQKRGEWLLIKLDDSHDGWIPADSAIVY